MAKISDYHVSIYNDEILQPRDVFGNPYPTFGVDYSRFAPQPNFEALEQAIIGVLTSRFNIPNNMVEVCVNGSHPYYVITIKYHRGDFEFNTQIETNVAYDYDNLHLKVSDAINKLIHKILATPAGKEINEKLRQIKFNLKDFKSWLESEAEDEEFVNVFMEYFGEEIDEEE
jgi:hypothetical protein